MQKTFFAFFFFVFLALFLSPTCFAASEKWVFETQDYLDAGPLLLGGTLYTPSSDGFLYAVQESSGQLLWKRDLGGRIYATPSSGSSLLFVGTTLGMLWALNPSNGQPFWNVSLSGEILATPAVDEDTVYAATRKGFVYAVDIANGSVKWTAKAKGPISGGVVTAFESVYFGSEDNFLYSVSSDTGDIKWSYPTRGPIWFSTPLYADNVVYVGSTDGILYALNAVNGTLIWSFASSDWIVSTPALVKGVLVFGSNDRRIRGLDPASGQQRWSVETGEAVQSRPVGNDNVAYVGSNDGKIYSVDVITGNVLWSYDLKDWVRGSPAVSGNMLYVPCYDKKLHALSSLSCEFTDPVNDTTLFDPVISIQGVAHADRPISFVEVMVTSEGAWQAATGTSSWSYRFALSQLPEGPFTISCRVTDIQKNTERFPYTMVNAVHSFTAPKMTLVAPSSAVVGRPFRIEARDKDGALIQNLTITTGTLVYSDLPGFLDYTPSKESVIDFNISRRGYASESVSVKVSPDYLLYYLGAGVVVCILVAAWYFRRRAMKDS